MGVKAKRPVIFLHVELKVQLHSESEDRWKRIPKLFILQFRRQKVGQ